jgi:hypothetical protein
MRVFIAICIAHFAEHFAQMYQLFILRLDRPLCLGLLGLWQPALIRSEWLHYLYAVAMLIGLYYWRSEFDQVWSQRTINLQHYHHAEHLLLLTQAMLGFKATGIGGLWFPRIELHFFYNAVVMISMLWALVNKNKHGVSNYLMG